ncbi:helix-turn-helix transcriptional regulator [Enterococcus gilvus]
MALAEQLKASREKMGLSQTDVANRLNITRQSISKWENGKGYPDLDNLVLLSEVYEVSIDELLKENDALKKK